MNNNDNKDCGCKDKDVADIAKASARRNISMASPLDELLHVVRNLTENRKSFAKLANARVSDFNNPNVVFIASAIGKDMLKLSDRLFQIKNAILEENMRREKTFFEQLNRLSSAYSELSAAKKKTRK